MFRTEEEDMEEQTIPHTMRLLSEESACSNLSSESCEYYDTEIYELLPSVQASRAEQNRPGLLESSEANQGGPVPEESQGHLVREQRDKASTQPIKSMPIPMQAKRHTRERRKMHLDNIGFWRSWWRTQSIKRKRAWEQMSETLSWLLPLQHTLRVIEGKFGAGVKAYFVFFRYLICLNLLHCALIFGFILGPTVFYGRNNTSQPLTFGSSDSILNFFDGTGYLDRSPIFYGFYTRGSLALPCLNTPLLYLAGIITILLLSLIMVVRRATVGYKHTWMLSKRVSTNVSFKIFCGWDFTIHDPDAAVLKHGFIRNSLKLILEEQCFSQRKAQRTLCQRVRLYLLRFILNVLVLALLCGAFYLIFFATEKSQGKSDNWLVSLFLQYLPPITITFVNLVLPNIFSKISSFEDYSFTMQVNAMLVRSIFLKLASLGIYLFFQLQASAKQNQCIENVIGRDMYKLCIFNFLITFCNTFFWNFPRKLVQDAYPTSLLAQLSGKPQFLVPFHVLDLVNIQTVFWVGVYHCPLLPMIGIVTLVATFYIKKFSVLRCCVAEQRLFQGSNSSVLFHFMLLLGLIIAGSMLGLHLFRADGTLHETSTCGPFGNGGTMHSVMQQCVDSLPTLAQTTVRYLATGGFAVVLILAEIIILTSYVSRGRANQRAIERLKDMLVMSSSDKRFLVKQHATMMRRRRDRVCPAAAEDDDPFSHGGVPASQRGQAAAH